MEIATLKGPERANVAEASMCVDVSCIFHATHKDLDLATPGDVHTGEGAFQERVGPESLWASSCLASEPNTRLTCPLALHDVMYAVVLFLKVLGR